jgi:acyl-lipid omega-6 desaturase (Delta-12 desaturase)
MSSNLPNPSALAHLRPTDLRGALATGLVVASTAIGITISLSTWLPAWLAGQAVLAAAFVQWFVILHECGHETLFRGRRMNAAVGTLAGLMSLIPFRTWRRVHGRHHKWTGWQDLDPTTESLAPRVRGRAERTLVNVCWRLWIPIFSIAYRAQNFWNLRRLRSMFPRAQDSIEIRRDSLALLAVYGAIVVVLGPFATLRLFGLALILSLIAQDLLLLSQHTHMPQHVSRGAAVRPYPAIEQAPFTRSLRIPRVAAALILNFDAHELHHMYPFVPGYHLHRVPYDPPNSIGFWRWIVGAKRLKAEVLLFENRLGTGLEL